MDFLTINDFQTGKGRLNIDGFTNISKGMSMDDFKVAFDLNGEYHIMTNDAAMRYAADLKKAQKADLQKADGAGHTIEEVNAHLSLFKPINVIEKGNLCRFWVAVKTKEEIGVIEKANENEFKKSLVNNDLQKGEIADAFQWNEQFHFEKTGKEIKEKLTSLKPVITNQKNATVIALVAAKKAIDLVPDRPSPEYMYRGFSSKIDNLLMYDYKYCRYDDKSPTDFETGSFTNTEESAKSCRAYNDLVRKYVDICVDLEYIDLYVNNMEEKKKYTLSPTQAKSLGF